jgi:hypothetical protein
MTERGIDFVAEFNNTASDYAYTDSLTDTDWAWEFLRRNPDYRAAYYESRARPVRKLVHPSGVRIYRERGCNTECRKWGLSAFADPRLNALQTDVFWSQSALTHSINASSASAISEDVENDLDLFRDQNCCAVLCRPDRQKIIIRSRNVAIDMRLVGINILHQPAQLQFHLDGFASIVHGTEALIWTRNALKTLRSGDKRTLTKNTRSQRKKYLVALDCALQSASLRETAYVFRALRLTRLSWSTIGDEALKKQVWRCRNSGLKFMQCGYRKFL